MNLARYNRVRSLIARYVLALGIMSFPAQHVVAQTFQGVDLFTISPSPGFPPGYAHAISADGIVGSTLAGLEGNPPTAKYAAGLWSTPSGAHTNLNPPTYFSSFANAVWQNQEVGSGQLVANGASHALLWTGTSNSPVDLHSDAFSSTEATGIGAGQQVGDGIPTGGSSKHALLWTGSSGSVVDLDTGTYDYTQAMGAGGGQQVGYGGIGNIAHALLWTGSAASAVDLHPSSAFISSVAYGADGERQVGIGEVTLTATPSHGSTYIHAAVWSGSANSVVDLNPAAVNDSTALDVNGNYVVGFANGAATQNIEHAFLWINTASSAIDLNAFLPSNFRSSQASYVDSGGNVYGYAFATDNSLHAVEWVAIPEPMSLAFAAIAGFIAFSRTRRRSRS